MNRTRITITTIVLCIVLGTLPLGASFYIAWQRAVADEQAQLALFAQRAISRSKISFKEIRSALYAIAALNAAPCSPEHIAGMRRLTVNTRSVEEIGYFENGLLKCTSSGKVNEYIKQSPTDFITEDGIRVSLRMQPLVTMGDPMMALQLQSHNVLTQPTRFADVIVDPGVQLAVATSKGDVLGDLNAPDPQLIKRIAAAPANSIDDEHLIAVVRDADLLAIAIEPRSFLQRRLRHEELTLLPLGLLIAVIILYLLLTNTRRRLSALGQLSNAVKRHEFIVHYQPIIELATGNCVGAEALARWRRTDGSLMPPDLFIPLAETSGLIRAITDQVIHCVIFDLQTELKANKNLHVSINLCAEDLNSGRALTSLETALTDSGIENHQIWLEATERGFIDMHAACLTLSEARTRGHAVAIDDFGTGYSSLSSLQKLPLDTLKIDKSFIDTIDTDAATSSVTQHIISMAKTLHLTIVAKGVETQVQADYLRRHGVEYVQGWFYAKAMPADEFIAYYRRNRASQMKEF